MSPRPEFIHFLVHSPPADFPHVNRIWSVHPEAGSSLVDWTQVYHPKIYMIHCFITFVGLN